MLCLVLQSISLLSYTEFQKFCFHCCACTVILNILQHGKYFTHTYKTRKVTSDCMQRGICGATSFAMIHLQLQEINIMSNKVRKKTRMCLITV